MVAKVHFFFIFATFFKFVLEDMVQLPVDFSEYMRDLLGEDEYKLFLEALQSESPVSIRVNPLKWKNKLSASSCEPVPWAEDGYYLSERPAFTFDPLFHAGCYYVQEASSMFVQRVLKQYVPTACTMLDLCAAPGGKSTLARAVLPEGSLLVSNEIIRARAQVLAENMVKWGHPDVVVTQNAPVDFTPLTNIFDVILADVPCSGEGMFRKDADSIGEWSKENVGICWQRQRSIVSDVWGCLKPGGLFIYSTCTYNAWEDEENIRWMMQHLGAEPLVVPVEKEWGICGDVTSGESVPVYRFLPSHVKGEGFFLAALRKPIVNDNEAECAFCLESVGYTPDSDKKKQKSSRTRGKDMKGKSQKVSFPSYESCRMWLDNPDAYAWKVADTVVVALPQKWSGIVDLLEKHLTILHAGISVASLKGRDWVPHHALAMSPSLHPLAFPVVNVDYETSVSYLRHEAVVLDNSSPRGYLLLVYQGVPLGFVKNVGNRANNLYPAEWRIRSGHLPEKVPNVL